jgi:hypothetical protein
MSTKQTTTKTATRVLTDVVRSSPVDEHLDRLHVRLLWIFAAIVVLVLVMI